MLDLDENARGPAFFSRTSGNFFGIIDSDYGGPPGAGRSSDWVREVLARYDLKGVEKIFLLAQPRILGHVFNPVSFSTNGCIFFSGLINLWYLVIFPFLDNLKIAISVIFSSLNLPPVVSMSIIV